MKPTQKFKEFIVKKDLLPVKDRWTQTVSAVGSLYRNVFYMLDPHDRGRLAEMMQDWGTSHSEETVSKLGVRKDLHGCAVSLLAFHRIFGIKSSIVEETKDRIVIHATKCMWKDKKGWGPQICASIDRYETGLVKGISKDVTHTYSKRRSKGDKVCEMVLQRRAST